MCGGGSSGGGGTNTVSTSTVIPDWQQGAVQSNENLATSLASQPYPTYGGQLIAGFSPLQNQGMQMAQDAAVAAAPDLSQAESYTQQAGNSSWNPTTASQYMSPYVMQALGPQLQQQQIQQAMNSNNINRQATQAGAYGDAQFGNQQRLNDFFGGLQRQDIIGQGLNQAYNTGLGAFQQGQQNLLAAGGQMAGLGQTQQQSGLTGANAVFNAGTQQQQLQQQQLTEAYQNFMNQVNWPSQMLNLRIASTANSPYQVPTANLAPTSATAQNLGAFASLAGGIGSLVGGGGGGQGNSALAGISERSLKKNIKKLGKLISGLPYYAFQYIWDVEYDQKYIGVMVDEVETIFPEAILMHPAGYKMVDYARIW